MTSRRVVRGSLAASALGLVALAALGRACGGDTAASAGDGAAGEAAAGSGTGGAGGQATGGAGGSGGTSGSGTGGTAGAAGDTFGATPVWKALPELVGACHVEKLQNPEAVRAFVWEPCSWSTGCEQAHVNPALAKQDAAFVSPGQVSDDGTHVIIALDALETGVGLFMREDGTLYAAYRSVDTPDARCNMVGLSAWGDRYGLAPTLASQGQYGAIVGSISQSDQVVAIPKPYPAPWPGGYWMGSKLWVWEWSGGQYSSMSNVDGSGFQQFASDVNGIGEIDPPAVAGDQFYFTVWRSQDGGPVMREIDRSDGLSDVEPFLVGTYDEQVFAPAYANSYFGFIKGLHPVDFYTFKDLEIWAAPYVTDPAKLQPFKLADYNLHNTALGPTFGGWGHWVVPTCPTQDCQTGQLDVWNIAAHTAKHYVIDPAFETKAVYGVTRKYVYAGIAQKGYAYATLTRLDVE